MDHTQTVLSQICHMVAELIGMMEQSKLENIFNFNLIHAGATTLKVTLPLASLSSFCKLSIDWLATLIPLISRISSPTCNVA